jgi:hypothetical protein
LWDEKAIYGKIICHIWDEKAIYGTKRAYVEKLKVAVCGNLTFAICGHKKPHMGNKGFLALLELFIKGQD